VVDTSPSGRTAPLIAEGLFSFQMGGSERVAADIALECRRRGYRIVCFAFYGSGGPIRNELEAAGVECVDLNYLSRTRFVRRLSYQVALFRFFRQRRVAALHIHHATCLILGAVAARLARVSRVVMTEHSIREFQTMPRYRRQSRFYCRFADAITVIHPTMEQYFRSELGVSRDRLHFVPNGIRLQEPSPAERLRQRHGLGVADGELLWMYAGRLAPVKDLGTLLRAFAQARTEAGPHLRLAVVGDGPERKPLETLCRSLGIAAFVSFLGARGDVPRLMLAADGFVMSSLSEGLPMVLLEAMAARVPCVATAVGGIPELFSDGAGILTPPQDPSALATAIARLSTTPDERLRIGQVGFAKVAANNSLDDVVDRYLDLLGLPRRWIGAAGSSSGHAPAGVPPAGH
jgi:glycosyltransferase involved in cell wall biosynthesis